MPAEWIWLFALIIAVILFLFMWAEGFRLVSCLNLPLTIFGVGMLLSSFSRGYVSRFMLFAVFSFAALVSILLERD